MGIKLKYAAAVLAAAVSCSSAAAECDLAAISESTAAEVFRACRAGAETGDTASELNLAYIYAIGKKYQDAAKWFRRAADHGSADAEYLLGTLYLE